MICNHCGAELREDALYCQKCGKKVTPVSPAETPENPAPERIGPPAQADGVYKAPVSPDEASAPKPAEAPEKPAPTYYAAEGPERTEAVERLTPSSIPVKTPQTDAKKGSRGKKKKKKRRAAKIVVAVLVLLLGIPAAIAAALHFTGKIDVTRLKMADVKSFISGGPLCPQETADAVFYIKDGALYAAVTRGGGTETQLLAPDFVLSADAAVNAAIKSNDLTAIKNAVQTDNGDYPVYALAERYEAGGRYVYDRARQRVYFPNRLTFAEPYALCYMDLFPARTENNPVKRLFFELRDLLAVNAAQQRAVVRIAEDVKDYRLLGGGDKLLLAAGADGAELYIYDFTDKKPVAKNAAAYRVGADGALVYCAADGENTFSYYSVDASGKTETLLTGAWTPITEDGYAGAFCAVKDGALYTVTAEKRANRLADIGGLLTEEYPELVLKYADADGAYFTLKDSAVTSYADYLTDPEAETDPNVRMPDRNDRKYWASYNGDWGGEPYPTAYTDQYYQEEAAYSAAQKRIRLREVLEEIGLDDMSLTALYVAAAGKYEKLGENVDAVCPKNGCVLFRRAAANREGVTVAEIAKGLKEEELTPETVRGALTEALSITEKTYIHTQNGTHLLGEAPIGEFDPAYLIYDNDIPVEIHKGFVYYIENADDMGNGKLYKRELKDGGLGEKQLVYEDTVWFYVSQSGDLVTFRNATPTENSDMFSCNAYVNARVAALGVYGDKSSGHVVFRQQNGCYNYISSAEFVNIFLTKATWHQCSGTEDLTMAKNACDFIPLAFGKAFYTGIITDEPQNDAEEAAGPEDDISADELPDDEPDETNEEPDPETAAPLPDVKCFTLWYAEKGGNRLVADNVLLVIAPETD